MPRDYSCPPDHKHHGMRYTWRIDVDGNLSSDPLARPRKALLRADWITAVVDVSSGEYVDGAITSIATQEPADFVNDDDETGGVVRG